MKSRGISWKDVFLAVVGSGLLVNFDEEVETDAKDSAGNRILRPPTEAEKAARRSAAAAEVVAYARAVADAAQESFDRDRQEEELARGAGPVPHRPSPAELGKIPGFR